MKTLTAADIEERREAVLARNPHTDAVLRDVFSHAAQPAHAYLLAGSGGSGKRTIARALAAELLARGSADPEGVRSRVVSGVHPDLTWVAPSGAHEMLRRDVDESVVTAATRTPFEASFRVFVLERAHTMNDETANSLLKTLEEPPDFVVLLLLSDRPAQILPTIRSRCQVLRFDPLSAAEIADRLVEDGGAPRERAQACARLAMGDGDAATMLASDEGAQLRKLAEEFARSPLYAVAAKKRAWESLLALGREQATAVKAEFEELLEQELEYLPRKEHRKCRTDYTERAQRAGRRAETQLCDRSLKLAGLWYRDLACLAAGAPELAYNSDRLADLQKDLPRSQPAALQRAISLIDETRAGLSLNLNFELACEALAYRLERLFHQSI